MTKEEKYEIMEMEEQQYKILLKDNPKKAARIARACFLKEKKLLDKALEINKEVIRAFNEMVPDDNMKRYLEKRNKIRKSKKWKYDQKKQGLEGLECPYCGMVHYRQDATNFKPGVAIGSTNKTIYLDTHVFNPPRIIWVGKQMEKVMGIVIWIYWCECSNILTFTRLMFNIGEKNDNTKRKSDSPS